MGEGDAPDAIEFSSRLLQLIDSGRLTATYKLATLTAVIDLCAETSASETLSAREVGRRVLELYWPQTSPFSGDERGDLVLRQSKMSSDIPEKLARFRRDHRLPRRARPEDAAAAEPDAWQRLEADVVATVVREPIPRLQRFGAGPPSAGDRFIYEIDWDENVSKAKVGRPDFDDTMRFLPGVADLLGRLGPILRPVLQARWTTEVAKRNADAVDEMQLSDFLFGAERISLHRVRGPLAELQDHRCFYCRDRLTGHPDVDHFIPWSRHPDNSLDNLVAAHPRCNGAKRDSLAGTDHLTAWLHRFRDGSADARALDDLRSAIDWPRRPDRTLGAARAAYLPLPTGTRLWQAPDRFEMLDRTAVHDLLVGSVTHRRPFGTG
ncbi:MAG: HNH endonuclease [Microthrixaceae bacterium]